MNIFWLDENLKRAAQAHCDKHVVKMCVEYAQLLSSVLRMNNPELCTKDFPYRLTHKNHPCAIWAREAQGNYEALKVLALWLGEEYTARYGKWHKSIEIIKRLPKPKFVQIGMTIPPQCMPVEYRGKNVVDAYRRYYLNDKVRIATWKTQPPEWWTI